MGATDFQRARTPAQQALRREEILAAARAMLDELTLADISLRELSRRVGLSKSNVVRYFPTREAVFLAVLIEEWDAWLAEVEATLPRPDRRRSPATSHRLVASAVASTLAGQPRFCDLLSSAQTVLERNIPIETAREFKLAALDRAARLAALVAAALPGLTTEQAFEFAGVCWVLVAGAWPMAHPGPVVAEVLADPHLAALCVDFVRDVTRVLTVLLDGFAAA